MSATDVAVENLLDESQWSGKIYSDGWVDGPTQIETTEPATGEVLGTAGGGDAASIARAAASAAEAQRAWAATPFAERAAIVRRAGELMEKHRAELIHWLIRESGAIPPKADHEISASIGQLETAAALTSEPLEVELPSMTPGRTSTARRAPARRRRRDHALELPLRARDALARRRARPRQRRGAEAGRQHARDRRSRDRAALRGGRPSRGRAARDPGRG